jgi:methyl-accepting chemotaxis protein
MTELEKELLNALDGLQSAYETQQKDWQTAYGSLQEMFEVTRRDNRALGEQVKTLSEQVTRLSTARSERTARLSSRVDGLSEQVESLAASVKRWTPEGRKR